MRLSRVQRCISSTRPFHKVGRSLRWVAKCRLISARRASANRQVPRLDCDLDRIKRGDLNRLGKLHAINPKKLRKEYPQSSATGTYARRGAKDRVEYRQAAGAANKPTGVARLALNTDN